MADCRWHLDRSGELRQQAVPQPRRHGFIKRHMEEVAKSGIVATHEVALYRELALLYGEDFARSGQWRGVVERVQSGKISLSDAVANQEGDVVHEV